jgi:hypothetical protein
MTVDEKGNHEYNANTALPKKVRMPLYAFIVYIWQYKYL